MVAVTPAISLKTLCIEEMVSRGPETCWETCDHEKVAIQSWIPQARQWKKLRRLSEECLGIKLFFLLLVVGLLSHEKTRYGSIHRWPATTQWRYSRCLFVCFMLFLVLTMCRSSCDLPGIVILLLYFDAVCGMLQVELTQLCKMILV